MKNWKKVRKLDMVIDVKKSCCMRIGPRNDYTVSNIVTCDGHKLPWSNKIRYLGTYIVQSRQFKCSLDYAKKSFFRSLNAICGKIGRNASEEVILELIRSKCIPILIFGLECFALTKSDLKSWILLLTDFWWNYFDLIILKSLQNVVDTFNLSSQVK